MITKIVINNFKKFEKAEFTLATDPVLFVGQNNGGKTTAIQAISLWHFFIRRWQSERAGSKAAKRTGVPIARNTISVVPVTDIKMIWRNGEVLGKENKRIKITITAFGKNIQGKEWEYGVTATYNNKELLYCAPVDVAKPIPEEAKRVFHLPPLSGVQTSEKKMDEAAQQQAIGEGRPGEILRNLLLRVQTDFSNNWMELKEKTKLLFQSELQDISYIPTVDPSIVVEYLSIAPESTKHKMKFEIANAGSGFLQFLLLAAFMYSHEGGSMLLIDEPDSHMHTFLQRSTYDWLQEIAAKTNSQLVISTHSEVLVNSTANLEQIITFFGKEPKTLRYEKRALNEVLGKVSPLAIINAEWSKKIFFAEGNTDFRVLKAFADILKHPTGQTLNNPSFFFHPYGTNNIYEAEKYFTALQKIISSDLKGFCLRDNVAPDNRTQEHDLPRDFQVEHWNRKEIENYLIIPPVLLRFLEEKMSISGLFLQPARDYLTEHLPPAVFKSPLQEDIGENGSDFLEKFFASVNLDIKKGSYWKIIEVMKPEEIHTDVKDMLNKLFTFFT